MIEQDLEELWWTYRIALDWTFPTQWRLDAARIIHKMISALATDNQRHQNPLFKQLMAALDINDGRVFHVALRILSVIPDQEIIEKIIDVVLEREFRGFISENLTIIRLDVADPSKVLTLYEQATNFERVYLFEAILQYPSKLAWSLLWKEYDNNINTPYGAIDERIISRALAKWNMPSQLWKVVQELDSNPKLEALFYLALNKDRAALDYLIAIAATVSEPYYSFEAGKYLSLLARPEGHIPFKRTDFSRLDEDAINSGITAAFILGTPTAVEFLLQMANLPPSINANMPVALADEAIRVLRGILPNPIEDHLFEYVRDHPHYDMEYSQASRDKAIAHYQQQLSHLEPNKRYSFGKRLTLTQLVEQLTVKNGYFAERAAYNLRAITGQNYDFNPDLDLIANLEAYDQWQEYVKTQDYEAGSWMYHNKTLGNG